MGDKSESSRPEDVRMAILDAARKIVAKEGFEGLSIRKITNAIDYSPGIIYHYFKNKDEIVTSLIREGYGHILANIGAVKRNEEAPEQEIKEIFYQYIKAALESPEYYMAVMLNKNPTVLQYTALLAKGTSQYSQALKQLRETLEQGMKSHRFIARDAELTAQIVWSSTFGLLTKLMLEDIDQEQIERLIDHHFNMLFQGILVRSHKGR